MPDEVEVIVRPDGESSWAAWSPQCPGLAVVKPTADALRASLPPALKFYYDPSAGRDLVRLVYNVEQPVGGVILRVRQDEHVQERQALMHRLVAGLDVPEQAVDLRAALPNSLGDVVYVSALPGDTITWMARQLESEDAIHVVLPATDQWVWSTVFVSGMDPADAPAGSVSLGDLGYDGSTTLGEVMRRSLTAPSIRQGILL